MPQLRISEAAELLGVSHDTVRPMTGSGRLDTAHDDAARLSVNGKDLAAVAREIANPGTDVQPSAAASSTLVTRLRVTSHIPLAQGPR